MHKELRDIMHTDTSDWDPDHSPSGETDPDVAYTEGWEKAEQNDRDCEWQASCPYPSGTLQHELWTKGFEDFRSDNGILN